MTKSKFLWSVALLCLLSLNACSLKKPASAVTAQILQKALPAMEEEDDLAYANQASLVTLKTLEGLQRVNPEESTILLILSQSFAAYTFGFVENDILEAKGVNPALEQAATDRAKRFYGRGKKFGLQLLSKNKNFKESLNKDFDSFKKSLSGFQKKDVPALFWAAFNWGSLTNFSKDSPEAIIDTPKIEALMKRVVELNDDYYYAGPHLFLGVFYSAKPKMLGGQPEEAKKEFELAIEKNKGKFLMTQVLYAQYYDVQMQNREHFRKILNDVVNTDVTLFPEQRLANELAKRRAQILLQKEKLFF